LNEPLHTTMDELIAKYLLGEATAAEVAEVERWVAENEANRKQFEHFRFLWDESRKLAAVSNADETLAWQRFKQKLEVPAQQPGIVISLLKKNQWLKIAAAVAILLTGAVLIKTLFFKETADQILLVQTQENTVTDTLPDGSTVTLNKNSAIEYNSKFTKGNKRSLTLKGEAFFTVVPDKKKPFIIKVNDIEVKVVGTSFNIKTVNGQTEVIVKTGVVAVTRNNKTILLRPAEKVITTTGDSSLTKQTETDKLFNYYESKEFVCDNTPLWRLVEVLNEAYDANIVIGRKELRSLPITTSFSNESLDKILQVIAGTFQLQVIKKDNQIVLQ
jgi:transmembrane sensor